MVERVVVTGLGAVTPLGLDVPSTWASMIEGRGGVDHIRSFDASGLPVRIAAEVKGFDPTKYMSPKEARRLDRFIHLGIAAAREALADAELQITPENAERVGVLAGSGIGGIATLVESVETMLKHGPERLSPFTIPKLVINMLSGQIAIDIGARGPNFGLVSACATSAHAIGEAFEYIRRGDADVIIAGGTEAGVVPIGIAAFHAMRAISTRNDAPEKASRPFDAQRDGFVVGEGGGAMVLESLSHALARGARIYAELLGYAATADAYHVTAPPEGAEGAARAMRLALRKAGITVDEVGYVNAHGTSTPYNDRTETQAIKSVFGSRAYDIPVSSTKSMTGHLLGAAGVVEAIACVKVIETGIIPPTINYEFPDPECDLDYVPNVARRKQVDVALSNSMGFGGQNNTLVFARYRG